MPGFDRTGPWGEGPRTGGARGYCNPAQSGPRPPMYRPGRGRGRGHRNMYWATGLTGWMRSGQFRPEGFPFTASYTKEQEVALLKEQAAFLKDELGVIDSRLRDLESEGKSVD